jgi:carbonic anhydrase
VFDFETVIGQIEISDRLHKIKKTILINHEDCGAYGDAGNYERHKEDLIKAKIRLGEDFNHLDVEAYYLHLNGTFEKI